MSETVAEYIPNFACLHQKKLDGSGLLGAHQYLTELWFEDVLIGTYTGGKDSPVIEKMRTVMEKLNAKDREKVSDDEPADPTDYSREPSTPGFYRYSGGNQNLIFLLTKNSEGGPAWVAYFANGDYKVCNWGYIDQALGVWDLVPLKDDTSEE